MQKLFLKILSSIRKFTSPVIWWIMKTFFLKRPKGGMWNKIKEYPLNVFNAFLRSQKYKPDPLYGIIDYTLKDPDYYFYTGDNDNVKLGKDCDDSAWITFLYLKEKCYVDECYMMLGMNEWNIPSLHFWVVAKFDDGNYRLFNYGMYNQLFTSVDDACKEFERDELVASGKWTNGTWIQYDKYIKDE